MYVKVLGNSTEDNYRHLLNALSVILFKGLDIFIFDNLGQFENVSFNVVKLPFR
jgi:hypothetical protein